MLLTWSPFLMIVLRRLLLYKFLMGRINYVIQKQLFPNLLNVFIANNYDNIKTRSRHKISKVIYSKSVIAETEIYLQATDKWRKTKW